MARVLFTMGDVQRAYFEEQRRGPGLGQIAAGAAGLAAAAGGTYLAVKNRKAIGEGIQKIGQAIGGYWRKTKKGAKTFVKDARTGRNTFDPSKGASISNTANSGGFTAAEVGARVDDYRGLPLPSEQMREAQKLYAKPAPSARMVEQADELLALPRTAETDDILARLKAQSKPKGAQYSRRIRTVYFSRRAY